MAAWNLVCLLKFPKDLRGSLGSDLADIFKRYVTHRILKKLQLQQPSTYKRTWLHRLPVRPIPSVKNVMHLIVLSLNFLDNYISYELCEHTAPQGRECIIFYSPKSAYKKDTKEFILFGLLAQEMCGFLNSFLHSFSRERWGGVACYIWQYIFFNMS